MPDPQATTPTTLRDQARTEAGAAELRVPDDDTAKAQRKSAARELAQALAAGALSAPIVAMELARATIPSVAELLK